jgi:hypothetical protein
LLIEESVVHNESPTGGTAALDEHHWACPFGKGVFGELSLDKIVAVSLKDVSFLNAEFVGTLTDRSNVVLHRKNRISFKVFEAISSLVVCVKIKYISIFHN